MIQVIISDSTCSNEISYRMFFFHFNAVFFSCYLVIEGPVKSSKSSHIGIIAGAAAGGCVLVLLLLLAVVYGFRQKNKAKRAAKKNNLFGKISQKLHCCYFCTNQGNFLMRVSLHFIVYYIFNFIKCRTMGY
jgi:hypothetical protein